MTYLEWAVTIITLAPVLHFLQFYKFNRLWVNLYLHYGILTCDANQYVRRQDSEQWYDAANHQQYHQYYSIDVACNCSCTNVIPFIVKFINLCWLYHK